MSLANEKPSFLGIITSSNTISQSLDFKNLSRPSSPSMAKLTL